MSYIEELQEAIRRLHGSESSHVETVPVKELFRGQTVWEGDVEVFDLHDHPDTHRVYAWAHDAEDADKRRHVTVLHIPPAVSPETAVRAAIIQEYRERQQEN